MMACAWWEGMGLGLVAFLTMFAYSPVFNAGFVWDDRAAILANPDVLGQSTWGEMLNHDFWGQDIDQSDSHKSFRPITTGSLRLEHWLAGGGPSPSAGQMHATNVAMHVGATVALHWMCRSAGASSAVALAVSLLFGVHAVHVDAVASVVGRAEVLAAVFFALSVVAYQRAVPPRGREADAWRSGAWVGCAALCVGAAVLCKEVGVTAVAVFLALEACPAEATAGDVAKGCGRDGSRAAGKRGGEGGRIAAGLTGHARWALGGLCRPQAWARLGPVLTATLGTLLWRFAVQGGGGMYRWRPLENRLAHVPRGKTLLLSTAWVHARAVGLILWPSTLAFDHGLGCDDLVHDVDDPRSALSAAAYGLLVALLVAAVALRRRPALVGMAVFVATYAPAANVLVFVGLEVAERVLYLPSAGLLLAMVDLIPAAAAWARGGGPADAWRQLSGESDDPAATLGLADTAPEGASGAGSDAAGSDPAPHADRSKAARSPVPGAQDDGRAAGRGTAGQRGGQPPFPLWAAAAVGLAAVALAGRTLTYAPAWRDEASLFRAGVEACPHGAKASNNLAYLLTVAPGFNETRDEAETLLRGALAQWPHHASAYLNLALLWSKAGVPAAGRFCGPPPVDEMAARATALGATEGEDAAFAPLWAGAVALHETPHQILFWLAKRLLLAASPETVALPPVTAVTVAEALARGRPAGDVALPRGVGWAVPNISLSDRQVRLGGGALIAWVSRFVKAGERHAPAALVRQGKALDHGILPPERFRWLPRHQLPYPQRYSDEGAASIADVPVFVVGLRLLEEASGAGAAASGGADVFRWRAVAASMGGSPAAAEAEARACLGAVGGSSTAHLKATGALDGAPGPPADAERACALVLAGALLQQGAPAGDEGEVASLLDGATAGMDVAAVARTATELARTGQREIGVELIRRAMAMPGASRNAALANNYGWSLDLAGRLGEAAAMYRATLERAIMGKMDASRQVLDVLRENFSRAEGRKREALRLAAGAAGARSVEVGPGGALA